MYRIAISYLGNQYDAEDVYQTVFFRFLKYNVEFNDLEHERRWFVVTTINVCKTMKSSKWNKNIVTMEQNKLEEIINTSLTPNFIDERIEKLLEAIFALPEETRVIVHLYYYEEYPVFEIAKFLDMSEMAVYRRLSRARKSIKKYLSTKGGGK